MPENKTLTNEERRKAIVDALEWSTTILINAMVYIGASNRPLTGSVTGPDGKEYFLSIKQVENDRAAAVSTEKEPAGTPEYVDCHDVICAGRGGC